MDYVGELATTEYQQNIERKAYAHQPNQKTRGSKNTHVREGNVWKKHVEKWYLDWHASLQKWMAYHTRLEQTALWLFLLFVVY